MRTVLLFALISVAVGFEEVTVIQYLQDHGGYTNFTAAIDRVGLTDLLNTTGPYTIFAPSDQAFLQSGIVTLDIFTPIQLKAVVEYTAIQEFILIPNVPTTIVKTTLANQNITIEPKAGSLMLNNVSTVDPTNNDIIVNNGIIQPVDKLLSPPVWPTVPTLNIYQQLLLHDDLYTDLSLAIVLAGLEYVVKAGEYTLFAPTDSAFAKYQSILPQPSDPDATRIYAEVVKNHLVPGERLAKQLYNGQVLYTLHNTPLYVSIGSYGVRVGTANVTDTDLLATNGVIHSIDDLLIPTDLKLLQTTPIV